MADVEEEAPPVPEVEEDDPVKLQVEGEQTYEKRGLSRVKAELTDFCNGYRMT